MGNHMLDPRLHLLLICVVLTFNSTINAKPLTIAVATNFLTTMEELSERFSSDKDAELTVVSGSSGQLVAQIRAGAPFDVLFSADQKRVDVLVELNLAELNSRFTYANGQLAFYLNPKNSKDLSAQEVFENLSCDSIVIANPKVAPYGQAAKDVINQIKSEDGLEESVVLAENVNQAFSTTHTGNVDCGFVAFSAILTKSTDKQFFYKIPHEYYSPIKQDAVILKSSKSPKLSQKFFDFVQSQEAKDLIREHVYLVD